MLVKKEFMGKVFSILLFIFLNPVFSLLPVNIVNTISPRSNFLKLYSISSSDRIFIDSLPSPLNQNEQAVLIKWYCKLRDIKKKVKNLPVDLLTQKTGIHPSKLKNISFLYIRLEQSLFRLNLRLVLSIALQYKDKGLDLYDLVYEGVRGLKKAGEKFDIEKGYAFSTYAYPWIKEYIRAALASSLPITLPRHVYKLLTKVNAIKQRLASANGRAPTDEELASEMGISIERFEIVRKAMALAARSNGATPLNYPNPRLNYHERTWEPILNDQGSVLENVISRENQPFEKMSNNVYSSDVMELIKTLPKEESSAIFSRLKGNSHNPSSGSTIQSNYIKGVKRLKRKALSDQQL